MKKFAKGKKLLFISVFSIFIVVILILAFRTDIKVVNYNVKSDKITHITKVAFISDLHSCDYGFRQSKLLNKVFAQEPDIVLLGGDIIDDKLAQDKAKEFLYAISEKYPCFYVSGNHEYWSGDIDGMKNIIKDYGISVLEGENVDFEVNGQIITICGVDDPGSGTEEFKNQLKNCNDNLDEPKFSILLTHRPERVHSYLRCTFDLILSGHAHGGQWRIPFISNGLLAPDQGFFPKYAGGFYKFDKTQMIVSRGLAKESTRVPRIFNRPEVVIINIVPDDN